MNSCNRSLELIKNYLNFHIFAYIGAIIAFQSESQFFSLVCDQCLDYIEFIQIHVKEVVIL